MKIFSVIACIPFLVSLTLCDEDTDKYKLFKQYIHECKAEFKLPNEREYFFLRVGYEPVDGWEESENCYLNCILEKSGFVQDGKFNEKPNLGIEWFLSRAGFDIESQVADFKETCVLESGLSKCETGRKLYECLFKKLEFLIRNRLVEDYEMLSKLSKSEAKSDPINGTKVD